MDESTPSQSLGAIISNLALRRFIYSAYVLALLVVGATQVAVTSLGLTNPDWLVATLAVLGYLGVPVAGLAVANTSILLSTPSTPTACAPRRRPVSGSRCTTRWI